MRTDTRVAQLFGLIQVRHGEVCGAQSLQASRGIGRAVAVCVRLDYRHDRRAAGKRTRRFIVVFQCIQIYFGPGASAVIQHPVSLLFLVFYDNLRPGVRRGCGCGSHVRVRLRSVRRVFIRAGFRIRRILSAGLCF